MEEYVDGAGSRSRRTARGGATNTTTDFCFFQACCSYETRLLGICVIQSDVA